MNSMDPERRKRLKEVAAIAMRIEREMGLPARLMIAQWAVESQWGAKPVGSFNFFGIKKAARHKLCCEVETHEIIHGVAVAQKLLFADYNSLAESCEDYAWLLTHGEPYRQAWSRFQLFRDFDAFARAVLAKYATAQYGALALTIASQQNVTQVLSPAAA
jgi:flagellum-specific peptidoglycan hydrolase FlgJ